MEFILKNNIFEFILNILICINIIPICILSFKEDIRKDYNDNNDNDNNSNNSNNNVLYIFKIVVTIIWLIIFMILIILLAFKYNFTTFFSLFYYLSFVYFAYKSRKKNINEYTYDNKMQYVMFSFLYLIFFSGKTTSIYFDTFSNMMHATKEYLLITFIIIKLIFFIFCIIINCSILISNIIIILNKFIKLIKKHIISFINKTFQLKFYNFELSNGGKRKKLLIFDIPLFTLLCPFLLIFNFILSTFIIFSRYLLKKFLLIGKHINYYLDNSSKIISRILKISIILSLLIVYGIITYNSNKFSSNTKDIYSLVITVILLPLIYDRIKEKNRD